MPTTYEKIYENILPKLRSYDLPIMTEEEVKATFHDYLIPATVRFHTCRQDLTDRDDELEQFNVDLTNVEIEIICNYMLLEYIDSNNIRTDLLLKVNLGSSDFNTYSPANMLDKLMEMHNKFLSENEGLLSRYSWLGIGESKIRLGAGYKNNNKILP